MKKRRYTIMRTMFGIVLCSSLLTIRVQAATVPMEMQPGTEIIYDEEGNPSVIKGGAKDFVEWEGLDAKIHRNEIPKDISLKEQMRIIQESDVLSVMIRDFKDRQDTIYMMPPDVVPNMKVVYSVETGDIDNIYYADKNEPSGYSLHGDERMQSKDTEKTHNLYQIEKTILKGLPVPFLHF